MSTQIPITPKELRSIRRTLRTQEQVVCLDSPSFVKITLVAMDMLNHGQDFRAKIIPPASAPVAPGVGTSTE